MTDRIYMDYAASAPMAPEAIEAMLPILREGFGNPSSLHSYGRAAREALDSSRQMVADALGARFEEITFTSGGTESDNLALVGVAAANRKCGNHLITTQIEHHAILETCRYLEGEGFRVTYIPVDSSGIVDPDEIRRVITPETILVSVMHANNEIGSIQPLSQIATICRDAGVPLHTDAVQSVGSLSTNVQDLGVDLLSLSAHKFGGPKGAGALYVRAGTRIRPIIHGGEQERERRAGTENVPGIVGMATALKLAVESREETETRIRVLRDQLLHGILNTIPGASLNGHPERRLPGNANIRFAGVEAESFLIALDQAGIAVSTGSACSSGALEPSHVLQAIGLSLTQAHESLRFSLGRYTTSEEVGRVLEMLPGIVDKLH